MGIFERVERERRATMQVIGPPRDPVIAAWFGGANSATGLNVTPDSAMKVTAVYRAVSLLAQTYASLPLEVYREGDDGSKTPDRKHPLSTVLRLQPNAWQSSFEWREMMAGHFALRGACYSEIVPAGGKAVAQLMPLHPDRVRPFKAPDGGVAFAYSPPDGPTRVILRSEMHYQHLLSADGITPISPIGMCREAVGLAAATEEHGARLFSNAARPGGLLKMPGHMKDDDKRRSFLKSWKDAFSGVRNAYKTVLLEDGMEWQQLGMTNEDAQFIDTRTLQLSEIARIFGLPPHKIYDLGRSTNNNIEHQGIEFVQDTIRPGAVRWEQAIRRDLFHDDTHVAMFDLNGLMRGDAAARAEFNSSALQNGYMSRNEVRISEGLNRSDSAGMDDYTIQLNMALMAYIEKMGAAAKLNGAANAA